MDIGSPNAALLVVVSAPSGGGKTTLCEKVLAANPGVARAVTCTTRAPRSGERDGIDYYFLDRASFEARVKAGEFLEHAVVYGNYYGTLKSEVLDKLARNQDVLLSIDVQGAAAVRLQVAATPRLREALVTVFLTPPSLKILEERLVRRGQDAPEAIQRRLAAASQEIAHWPAYDYLIMSAGAEEDFARFQTILRAEKMKAARSAGPNVV